MCNKNRAKEYYKNNRDVILNRSKEYYTNNKESILEHLKNKYQSLTKDKKQKIKDYQADFGQVKKIAILLNLGKSKNCHFANFGKSKKIISLLWTSRKIIILLTLGKSLRWSLIFNLNKTPLGETGCLSNPYFLLTGYSCNKFYDSPPFPTQSVRLPLVTYFSLCSTCVTYRTLCHAIGPHCFPPNPYLGKWRIS